MTPNTISKDISQKNALKADKQQNFPFEKAVVVHVVTDPSLSKSFLASDPTLFENFNPDKGKLPRNSCIVRLTSNNIDAVSSSPIVTYPFFQSHISMPVKVGETVWVMFDREIKNFGYWMSRVHGDELSEDINYSHYDRTYQYPQVSKGGSPGTYEKFQGKTDSKKSEDDFPNLSLAQKQGNNEFDKIVSSAGTAIRNEPVPRILKRPGDMVIHGSNNSMILFGSDRYWKKEDKVETFQSNGLSEPKEFSGCVDIVAGRSRGIISGSNERTTPEIFENSRGYREIIKDPKRMSKRSTVEGDPDFYSDASRIYISMSTSIDDAISLNVIDNVNILPNETEIREPKSGASILAKSDHIRILARKDEELNINGTIKIVKEGEISNEGDGCSISLLDDGIVHIAAPKIYLGLSTEQGGEAARDTDSKGDGQPYIKYQELKQLLESLLSNLDSFCQTLNTHVTPGYGLPSPQILQASSTLQLELSKRKNEIPNVRSKRIFGE